MTSMGLPKYVGHGRLIDLGVFEVSSEIKSLGYPCFFLVAWMMLPCFEGEAPKKLGNVRGSVKDPGIPSGLVAF